MIKDTVIPQCFNSKIYNPSQVQIFAVKEKKGAFPLFENARQQIIQWLALVGNNAGVLVLLN